MLEEVDVVQGLGGLGGFCWAGVGGRCGGIIDCETSGTWTGGGGVGTVAWGEGAGGEDVSIRSSWTVIVRPLGRINLYKNEVCPAESVFCSTFFTIASTIPNQTVYAVRNKGVGGGRCNKFGGYGRGNSEKC